LVGLNFTSRNHDWGAMKAQKIPAPAPRVKLGEDHRLKKRGGTIHQTESRPQRRERVEGEGRVRVSGSGEGKGGVVGLKHLGEDRFS